MNISIISFNNDESIPDIFLYQILHLLDELGFSTRNQMRRIGFDENFSNWSKNDFDKDRKNRNRTTVLAVDERNVVAGVCQFNFDDLNKEFFIYSSTPSNSFIIKTMNVSTLIVDEAYRKQKIGSMLMNHLKKIAKNEHCATLSLNVLTSNIEALWFYNSHFLRPISTQYLYKTFSFIRHNKIIFDKFGKNALNDKIVISNTIDFYKNEYDYVSRLGLNPQNKIDERSFRFKNKHTYYALDPNENISCIVTMYSSKDSFVSIHALHMKVKSFKSIKELSIFMQSLYTILHKSFGIKNIVFSSSNSVDQKFYESIGFKPYRELRFYRL